MKRIFLIILILLGSACEREPSFVTDAEGVVTKMEPLWIAPQNDSPYYEGTGTTFLEGRVVHNNHRLFGGEQSDKKVLMMRHIETGKILWEWTNFLSLDIVSFSSYTPHQYQNYLFLQDQDKYGSKHYCINMETGQTVWQEERDKSFNAYYTGLDEYYFLIGSYDNTDGYSEGIAFKGNILTGEQDTFFYPKYSREHLSVIDIAGYIEFLKAFKNEITGESYVAIIFNDPLEQQNNVSYSARFLALYNLSQGETVYEKEAIYSGYHGGRVAEDPVVVDDKIYMAGGNFIACNNVYTGKSVWKKSFTTRFYGLAVDGDKVLANSSFDNQYNTANLYALDRETGSQLWRTPSSGTSSRLVTLNGVAYFVGGGDGLLHAVDIETGNHIWRLISPDEEHNSGAFFAKDITAVPGRNGNKGIILVSSYLSAMAFEAAR